MKHILCSFLAGIVASVLGCDGMNSSAGIDVAISVQADPGGDAISAPQPRGRVKLTPIGGFTHGRFGSLAAEIVAYDSVSRRLFVVNGE